MVLCLYMKKKKQLKKLKKIFNKMQRQMDSLM